MKLYTTIKRSRENYMPVFEGFVHCEAGSVKLWTEGSNILRLNDTDAQEDANTLKQDIVDKHTI